jgi:O-antigen/teichoic acid export membrane protein
LSESTPSPLDIKFNQRFSGNLLSNIAYFILNIIIGLALVPFFLDTLGVAAYGLIPLATSITGYVTIAIDSINAAVTRFLTVDLHRSDLKRANETFNTAVFATLGVIICLVPVAIAAAWIAPLVFNIGDESVNDVFLLFVLVFGSVLIRTWSSNFMVTLFAYNRLDLRNCVNIANIGMQVFFVVVLFYFLGPSLPLVGVSYFLGASVALILSIIFSRRVCPELKVSSTFFVRSRLREIGGVAGWTACSSLAYLLRYSVALIIVNIMFGNVAGTQYSLVITWGMMLLALAGLVTNTFTPKSYSYRAKDDKNGLTQFTLFAMRCTGLAIALPIAFLCVFSPQIMTIWVGAKYTELAPLVWIILAPMIIRIQTSCTDPIFSAYLRVREPAIFSIAVGVLNVGLALLFPVLFHDGMYGVAYAGSLVLLMVGAFFLMFNAHVLQIPLGTFFRPIVTGVTALGILSVAGILYVSVIPVHSLLMLIVSGILFTSVYGLVVLRVVLKKNERDMIRSCVPAFAGNLIPCWIL